MICSPQVSILGILALHGMPDIVSSVANPAFCRLATNGLHRLALTPSDLRNSCLSAMTLLLRIVEIRSKFKVRFASDQINPFL